MFCNIYLFIYQINYQIYTDYLSLNKHILNNKTIRIFK